MVAGTLHANFNKGIYKLHVARLYPGVRSNILDTLYLINKFSKNKTSDYETLFYRMRREGHIAGGGEVFSLGLFIKQDLGPDSYLLGYLPRQVELSLNENASLAFSYRHNRTHLFPFKYHYASDLHTDTSPYQFTFANDLYAPTVAITYANQYQLILDSNDNLIDELTSELKYNFRIDVVEDETALNLVGRISSNNKYFLTLKSQVPDYFFHAKITWAPAEFTVEEYSVQSKP